MRHRKNTLIDIDGSISIERLDRIQPIFQLSISRKFLEDGLKEIRKAKGDSFNITLVGALKRIAIRRKMRSGTQR